MAGDVPETPPTGPEVQGPGQPPATPEPQTPEQQVAARAESAAAPELDQTETQPEEGLEALAQDVDQAAAGGLQPDINIEPLREVPPQTAETPQVPEPQVEAAPPQPAVEAQTVDAGDARAQAEANVAQSQAQLQRYRQMPENQFSAELQRATLVEQQLRDMANSPARISPEQRQQFINDWNQTRGELALLQTVANERSGASTGINERDQIRQRERQRAERIADLGTKSADELKGLNEQKQSVARTLEQRLRDEQAKPQGEQDANAIKAIEDELREAKGEADEVKGVYEQKSGQHETEQTQEDRETKAKELEDLQREAADPGQLRANIDDWKRQITDLEDEIDKLDERITGTKSDEKRTQLEDKKSELTEKLVNLRQTLKKDQDALEKALQRERDEFTLKDRMSQDTLRRVSRQDYLQMDEEARSKYLQEIMEVTQDATEAKIRKIQEAIGQGQPLSIEDRAQYSRYLADRIINQGGRGDLELEYFMGIAAEYPEMAQAVFDRVTRAESAKKTLKERFPNNWEKMINFAKRHPAWMAILIALLVGGAAAVGAAVAPAAGIGLGLGGSGAAAGGAGLFGRADRK